MAMDRCANCGGSVTPVDRYCGVCGAPVPKHVGSVTETSWFPYAVGGVSAVAATLLTLFFLKTSPDAESTPTLGVAASTTTTSQATTTSAPTTTTTAATITRRTLGLLELGMSRAAVESLGWSIETLSEWGDGSTWGYLQDDAGHRFQVEFTADGTLYNIHMFDHDPGAEDFHARNGVGFGSSVTEVLAAFPNAEVLDKAYFDCGIVVDDSGFTVLVGSGDVSLVFRGLDESGVVEIEIGPTCRHPLD